MSLKRAKFSPNISFNAKIANAIRKKQSTTAFEAELILFSSENTVLSMKSHLKISP